MYWLIGAGHARGGVPCSALEPYSRACSTLSPMFPVCLSGVCDERTIFHRSLRDEAVKIITQRIDELDVWREPARARVGEWFGIADEPTRGVLTNGLVALISVMNGLTARNFVRSDPDLDRALGCTPNTKNLDGEVAHVCGPDTATHTISISPKFCELPDTSAGTFSSMQLTIVHECVHFRDTFGAVDYKNTYGQFLSRRLAKEAPTMAIRNADNIAWYILCID
ncbi:hypothetical protein FCJ61_18555 [Burkholderia metallica]|nr:hypothetical protein [Burkholderia metallica]